MHWILFADDGRLISGSGTGLKVWSENQQVLKTLPTSHRESIESMCLLGGRIVVTGCRAGEVNLTALEEK